MSRWMRQLNKRHRKPTGIIGHAMHAAEKGGTVAVRLTEEGLREALKIMAIERTIPFTPEHRRIAKAVRDRATQAERP